MKKIFIAVGIIIAFIIIVMAFVPIVFKPMLLERAKTTINKRVNADVQFTDLKISLLRSFPKLSLELTDVVVTGIGEFKADTLFSVPSLRTKTGFMQLFNKEQMGIEEIIMNSPRLKLVVAPSGSVNWDLVPVTDPVEELPAQRDTLEDGMELQLENIEIRDALFIYDDREIEMFLQLDAIDIDISGKMYGTEAQLLGEGFAEQLLLRYGGVNYITNTRVETRTVLNVDYEKMDIEIQENELLVNRLPLEVLGLIQMPGDSMFFDLHIKTKASGFDNFLALVPPDYEHYLEGVETDGTATLSGTVKGLYFEENYPALELDLDVENGNLHYTELPEKVKNISADISVSKPQGELDLTTVSIAKAHAEVKNSPVDLSLQLKSLVSDPHFDGRLLGKINFSDWKEALPLDSITMAGMIDADLTFRGNYSSIEKEQYDQIASDGRIKLTNFVYETPALTQQIKVPEGTLVFTPRAVNLEALEMLIGQSDFLLSGSVTNYLDYLFTDGLLAGNLQLTSSRVNLNELLRLQVETEDTSGETPATGVAVSDTLKGSENLVFTVPGNIDFTFRSDIRQVIFERLPITDVNGLITARAGKLVLDGLTMQMLKGEMKLTGSYGNTEENRPLFDFGFDLTGIDIPEAYRTLISVQRMIPIARQSEGIFNTSLKLNGRMGSGFNLIPATITGNGTFSTENLQIRESSIFSQLQGILQPDKLRQVKIDDFRAAVVVTDGTINLKPFSTRIAGQETNITGTLNPENLLDMRLDFNIQRNAFGTDIQNILNVLPGQERIQVIPASVILNGPVGNPEVKIDLEAARKLITDEVKRSTKENVQENLNKIGEGLRKLIR